MNSTEQQRYNALYEQHLTNLTLQIKQRNAALAINQLADSLNLNWEAT